MHPARKGVAITMMIAGCEHCPAEQRHLPQTHFFRTHIENGHDEVNRTRQSSEIPNKCSAHRPYGLTVIAVISVLLMAVYSLSSLLLPVRQSITHRATSTLQEESARRRKHSTRGMPYLAAPSCKRHNIITERANHRDDEQENHHCTVHRK